MRAWILAGAVCAGPMWAGPAWAQDAGPGAADVYAAFVGAVPEMVVEGSFDSADPAQAGRLFLTMVLAELGGGAESLGDDASLSAVCEAGATPDEWACRLSLGIKWDGAESAYVATFEMAATDVECRVDVLDVAPALSLCAWEIVDNHVRIDLYG